MQLKSSLRKFIHKWLPRLKIYFLIISCAVAIFYTFVYVNSYFQLKIIQIEGEVPKKHLIGLERLKDKNLYFLSTELIKDTISINNPDVFVDEIIKVFPNKLILKLKLVEPIAQIKLNSGLAILSHEGKILGKIKQPQKNLPIINFYQKLDYYQLAPGNVLVYREVIITLILLKKTLDLDLIIESIDINGLNMIVFNLREGKILLSAEKDKDRQIFELESLIGQFKIKAQDFKILDLRFDKPIVKF